jgi:hypothetical protein
MIPGLVSLGNPTPWPVLPPGIHLTDFVEIERRFAYTPHRRVLFGGLAAAAKALARARCQSLYINGSFTTDKPHPGDFDGCWDPSGVDLGLLDPVLLTFENGRAVQKAKYHGEMFLTDGFASATMRYLEFFQIDKFSGRPKGILKVHL